MAYFSGFLETPSISETCITDQIDDKAVAYTCNDDSNLEWYLLSKSWIEWMEWTVHQVLMVVLECVKRHPKILKTFEKLAFSVNKNSLTHTICYWFTSKSKISQFNSFYWNYWKNINKDAWTIYTFDGWKSWRFIYTILQTRSKMKTSFRSNLSVV